MRLKRTLTLTALPLVVVAGSAMFPKPSARPTVLPVPAGMSVDAAKIFNRACKDCHSNQTEWPWYASIPPVSLAMKGDVRRGREFLNLSEWDSYTKGRKLGLLSAMQVALADREMPPRTYRFLHPGSCLTAPERRLLARWAMEERGRLRSVPSH